MMHVQNRKARRAPPRKMALLRQNRIWKSALRLLGPAGGFGSLSATGSRNRSTGGAQRGSDRD